MPTLNPKIVQKGHPVLSSPSQEVSVKEITTPKIKKVIEEMKKELATQKDGVAIAAPQLGYPYRIFIISPTVFERGAKERKDKEVAPPGELVYINPTIIKESKGKTWLPEGCLSVRWWYGEVHRARKVTVRAYNEKGVLFERGGAGLLAQIFQHETDHLNGILFDSKARNLKEFDPESFDDRHDEHKK